MHVRVGLQRLLMEKATDNHHQEVLCLVFCPKTNFNKPILDFDLSNLACLVMFAVVRHQIGCVGDPWVRQLSGVTCLEAHQQ